MRKWLCSPNGILAEVIILTLLLGFYQAQKSQDMLQDTGNTDIVHINSTDQGEEDYIKWVDFGVTSEAMKQAYHYDVDSSDKEIHLDWIELLAYLGAKYGGDFSKYRSSDLDDVAERMTDGGETMEEITADMEHFSYYCEAYGAVLGGMVGEYEMEASSDTLKDVPEGATEETQSDKSEWKRFYGLKAFNPIAKGFPYSDYDDFGVSRSYGYRRNHLGHDMMGQVGTPVVAVESGVVSALGWNQYGGWRIGIDSFDGKRYYYYAHLRQNRPYAKGLEEGSIVQAGDVIGYVGRTGYSAEENVNNIDEYHLHFGLQLIFDESQRDGNNEIWVSCYELVRFLSANRSDVTRNDETKEWTRTHGFKDPQVESYQKEKQTEEKRE